MAAPPTHDPDPRSSDRQPTTGTAAAARALAEDMSALIRAEIALAKAELEAGITAKATGAGMLAAAGALGGVATLVLLVALGFALSEVGGLPGWASALIVAGLLLLVAGILVLVGRSMLKTPVELTTTKERIQEDVAWAKQQIGR